MLLLPTQRKAVASFCQGNNIIISWRCYILFLVVWRCQKCIWKLLWTALYLFNALLKDGRRSNTLAQLSLHYIKNLENHGTAQMFFIKLNLTPLFLTMTYPGKSISSVYVLSRKKEKGIKRLGIECAVYLLLTTVRVLWLFFPWPSKTTKYSLFEFNLFEK